MQSNKQAEVVTINEGWCQVWLPLCLLLYKLEDFVGVRAGNDGKNAIVLHEIFGKFQGQPLQMENPLMGSQCGNVCGIICPTWVKCLHKSVVLL